MAGVPYRVLHECTSRNKQGPRGASQQLRPAAKKLIQNSVQAAQLVQGEGNWDPGQAHGMAAWETAGCEILFKFQSMHENILT